MLNWQYATFPNHYLSFFIQSLLIFFSFARIMTVRIFPKFDYRHKIERRVRG